MDKAKNIIKKAYARTSNVIKTHWKKIISGLILLIMVIAITVLGVMKFNDNKKIKDQESNITSLNSNLSTANSKITQISDALALTEEGKKQLESINTTLEADKSKLTNDNQALTEKVSSVEAQLAAKQRELNNTQVALNQKNAELANANKCLALFKSVQSQFDAFNANINKAQDYYTQAFNAETEEEFNRLIALGDQAYNAAMASFRSMEANINKFKSGKC